MGIFDGFKNKDTGEVSVGQLEQFYKKEFRRRKKKQQNWEIQKRFFEGDHYCYINNATGYVDPKQSYQGTKLQHKVRISGTETNDAISRLVGRLTKERPSFAAVPNTDSQTDLRAAKIGNKILKDKWDSLSLDDKYSQAVLTSLVNGHGFWEIWWDASAETPIPVVIDPVSGKIVDDPAQIEELQQVAATTGVPLQEETLFLGDVCVDNLLPGEVMLLGSNDYRKAYAAIKSKGWSVEAIKNKWNVSVKPDSASDESESKSTNEYKNADDQPDFVMVKELYIKPCNEMKEGFYAVWCKDKLLVHGPYPYKHGKLPFVSFEGFKTIGEKRCISAVQLVMDLQKAIDRTTNQIHMYKNLTTTPQMIAPRGSIVPGQATTVPGAIIEYNATDKPAPMFREPPQLPSYVFTQRENDIKALYDAIGVGDVSRGDAPGNIQSALGVIVLQEQDAMKTGVLHRGYEQSLSDSASLIINLVQENYTEQRIARTNGPGSTIDARSFKGTDLSGIDHVRTEADSTLPRSKGARQERLMNLVQNNILPIEDVIEEFDVGDTNIIMSRLNNDRAYEQREIDLAKAGTLPQPPQPWENDQVAMHVLEETFKSVEFQFIAPEIKQALLQHWMLHQQQMQQKQGPKLPEGVRINVQERRDLTATEAAEYNNAAGIHNPDPQDIMDEEIMKAQMDNAAKNDHAAAAADAKAKADMTQEAFKTTLPNNQGGIVNNGQ